MPDFVGQTPAGRVSLPDGLSGVFHYAVKTAQHGQRKDHLAVFVALVGASEQVAYAPDESGELLVSSGVHGCSA